MLKLKNLRIGKGLAIVNRQEQKVSGFGSDNFKAALVSEFGIVPELTYRNIPEPLINRDPGDEADCDCCTQERW